VTDQITQTSLAECKRHLFRISTLSVVSAVRVV